MGVVQTTWIVFPGVVHTLIKDHAIRGVHGETPLSGAGVVGDRKLIPEFTGKSLEDKWEFPVNSPDCMVLDQSVNNTWKKSDKSHALCFL